MTYKTCTVCGRLLPEDKFQVRRASPDGRTAACRECLSERDRARANHPHRVAAREAYQQTEQGRAAVNRAKRAYKERNPESRRAHHAVNNAVRDGKLTKPDACERCGGKGRLHGHHEDYGKPLDVDWLCTRCHREVHT